MIDSNTLVLMHFDTSKTKNYGSLGDFTFEGGTDPSSLDTSIKKWGTASLKLPIDNSVNKLRSPLISVNNEWTMEGWAYLSQGGANNIPMLPFFPQTPHYLLYLLYSYGNWYFDFDNTGAKALNKNAVGWHYYTLVQNNSRVYFYFDGRLIYSTAYSTPHSVNICVYLAIRSSIDPNLHYDEMRFSNVARYLSDFTPPSGPLDTKKGLIESNQGINLLDNTSITGITTTRTEPTDTTTKLVFGVDGTWNKLTIDSLGGAALSAVATQTLTADSVLSEGNTPAELDLVTDVPGFEGKMVYPAVAMYAGANAVTVPTLKMSIEGQIDTTVNVYTYTDYSQEYILSTDGEITIVSVIAETSHTGNGSVAVTGRIYQNNAWTDYMSLLDIQMESASKIQLKAVYTVQTTDGTDSCSIDRVTITYNTTGSVVSDATTDIVTITQEFINDLSYIHAYIKHEPLIDAEIDVYCSLRNMPQHRSMVQIGQGTGSLQTYNLTDTGINQDTIAVYIDGVQMFDFGYNTETSQITLTAPQGAAVSASYNYGWGLSNWNKMTQGSTQINESGKVTTEYTYTVPAHEEASTVSTIKYQLVRPEGIVTNQTIGVGTGATQIIPLPHVPKYDTIICTGQWSYNQQARVLTVIAPAGDDIVISYDWIAETPHVYGITAGWAETIE